MAAVDVIQIPIARLLWVLAPVVAVWIVMSRLRLRVRPGVVATLRMAAQLLLVGYVLTAVFQTEQPALVLLVLAGMTLAASWIALGPLGENRMAHLGRAVVAIGLAGGATLALVTQIVLEVEPWYAPRQLIPLGGMLFASSMNAVSLAADRLQSETAARANDSQARSTALKTALLPATNSLLAVGIVSLPGMMTGQILSGTDPLLAVRYQIMVMAMLYGSQGLAAASYLALCGNRP